jgi:integrase
MALSDVTCRQTLPIEKLQKLSDGGGLQLWITPNGARLWRLAYRYCGKQKVLAIGPYPMISLAEARTDRDDAKRLLLKGVDPSRAKKDEQEERLATTFRGIAEEYVARIEKEGRAEKTIFKTKWLLNFAYPILGDLPIREIGAPTVLRSLRKLETRGRYESARRMRSTLGKVFRYAIATGRAQSDPTLALRDALIRPTVTPRPAITEPTAFGALLRAIDDFDGQPSTCAALQLLALFFTRPGELRSAEWIEFDFERAVWTIPAARMKMRRRNPMPHRVPLASQAVAILKKLRKISDGELLFPSIRTTERPISEGTLNAALRRLGYRKDEMTPHGFRAAAASLLNECGKWNSDAIERQLAHVEGNDVRRAYVRSEFWDERVQMMSWWADYLDILKQVPSAVHSQAQVPASPRKIRPHVALAYSSRRK